MHSQRATLALVTGLLGTIVSPNALEIAQAQSPSNVPQAQDNQTTEAETLFQQGFKYWQSSQFQKAVQSFEAAWKQYRAIGDTQGETKALIGLGLSHHQQGNYRQAITFHQQSLALARKNGDQQSEATSLGNLGLSYRNLGQFQQAIVFHQQQRAIARVIRNRHSEAAALVNLGIAYASLSQYQPAIRFFQQSLAIAKETGDLKTQGGALTNLGLVYADVGEYQDAIANHLKALDLQRQIGNRQGEAKVLTNLGLAYQALGKYGKAIGFHQQALAIERQSGDRLGEAKSLGNLGVANRKLGKYQEALQSFQQMLKMARQIGNRQNESNTLSNLGDVYHSLEQYEDAIASHQQALSITQELGDQEGEATAFNNLGLVYFSQGKYRKATKFHQRSLNIARKIGDRQGEAISLGNLGNAYYGRRQFDRAINYYQQSLTLAKALGLRAVEGRYLSNLGHLLAHQGQTKLAIIFLKQSVNVREQIRQDLQGLSQTDQQSYTDTVAKSYRLLADLLLQEDRVIEAQTILDLIKVQELDDLLQGVRGEGQTLNFLQPELALLAQYQESQKSAIALIQELDQLTQKARRGNLSAQQQQRRQELLQVRQDLQGQFNDFLRQPQVKTLLGQLSRNAVREPLDLTKLNSLQDNLAKLNGVLLYPLILEDRLELVITTPTAPPLRRVVPVSRTELNQKIAEFRSALDRPTRDAVTPAQQLYDWLIRPLEADLKQANPDTILFAPDGQLRYIPLAALHDGEQWLTQNYQITNITTTSQTDFDTTPQANPRILAGAFTDASITRTVNTGQRSLSFQGLPFAGREVQTLVASQPGTTALLDRELNVTRTIEEMDLHQIIHFATHAAFLPSDPDASFIVFGEGKNPTLKDIATWPLSHVDLVVLSACETGLGSQLGNGVEVLGLGYQFQVSGAKAVIASLWQVSDGGTQTLMNAFYKGLQGGRSKAEALRQAQITLIEGNFSNVTGVRGDIQVVGSGSREPVQHARSLEHPYYWAPFILIGNSL